MTDDQKKLYRHVKRDAWGYCILLREDDDHRTYHFEDGQERTIRRGFYTLMEEVGDERLGEVDRSALVERLWAGRELMHARQSAAQASGRTGSPVTVAQQVEIFRGEYPEGFDDAAWVKAYRGETDKKAKKKQREPAIAKARELMEAAESDDDAFCAAARAVLASTNLVRSADLAQYDQITQKRGGELATVLRELVDGKANTGLAFQRFIALINSGSGTCTWPLASALQALCRPNEDVFVHPTSFRKQAVWLRPKLAWRSKPDLKSYSELKRMLVDLRQELESAGLKPRDNFDLSDFVQITLRPAALKQLDEQTKASSSSAASSTDASSAASSSSTAP